MKAKQKTLMHPWKIPFSQRSIEKRRTRLAQLFCWIIPDYPRSFEGVLSSESEQNTSTQEENIQEYSRLIHKSEQIL